MTQAMKTTMKKMVFRREVYRSDEIAVREILETSGFFLEREISVACELVRENLEKGEISGYSFLFAETEDRVVGYACFGRIPTTASSYDLYWIAVHPDFWRRNLGSKLLSDAESLILGRGGQRVYIETSARALYEPTRSFYERAGYSQEALLRDYYGPGDDKIIFVKVFS